MRFIAFDLETTGIVPGVDQIVEIGAVRFVNGIPDAVYATLVDPRTTMPAASTAVNKITDDMLVGKPHIETLLESFTQFCAGDPLVAYNAPFDTQFLARDYIKYEFETPRGIVLDALPVAKKVFPGLANYKLGTVLQYTKIAALDFHRAEEDAASCGKLLIHMVKKIVANPLDLPVANLVAMSGKPEVRFPVVERQPKQLAWL